MELTNRAHTSGLAAVAATVTAAISVAATVTAAISVAATMKWRKAVVEQKGLRVAYERILV